MSDISIKFEDVGKLYNLKAVGTGTLSHDLNRWWQTRILGREDPYLKIGETNNRSTYGTSEYVWALQHITFDVKEGEVVGIIGKNGAGKSTLLKLLSRVTAPTTGLIRARGRIASLLEVGTGFNADLTGRDNIFMNGSILGMSTAEIRRKLDEIISFAGVERYIDTPVKRYSSGMTVRLGFAVAAFLEPEILVVDEVLAVGDAEFQKKAIGKMQDISHKEGRTVLFVSHNMASIRNLCTRGVLLEDGMVRKIGSVSEVIKDYLLDSEDAVEFDGIDGDPDILFLKHAALKSDDGQVFYTSSKITVEFVVEVVKRIPSLVIGFNVFSAYQYPLARADYNNEDRRSTLEPGCYSFSFEIPPFTLAEGDYQIVFDVAERNIKCHTTDSSRLSFSVTPGNTVFGNIFADDYPLKKSIIQEKWNYNIEKLR